LNRVLIVDDDPNLLAGFRRQLRRKVDLETVESGPEGLDAIRRNGPFSVVVSDYCMPEMNGVEFLAQVRALAPETVRMMLTGSGDLHAAIQAINLGNIFRFLTKPCGTEELLEALRAGIGEYRRTHKERKFNRRTRRSLTQAMEVQQGMLPTAGPALEGLEISGRSIFCDQTGGDYYDYFENGGADGRLVRIVVGDVSDHGLSSALLMTSARAFFRERATQLGSIAGIVAGVNRQLTHDTQATGRFMTVFFAEIDPGGRSIRWVRAGHDPALVYDPGADAFAELDGQGGLPLGVFAEARYETHQRPLAPGQVVVMATDGVWEARNPAGRMFGKPMLQQVIRENAGRPPEAIISAIFDALTRFLEPLQLQDDATLVVAKVGG
jgi:serine phosphatase RsbU (regulator of sigma subunit)